MLVRKSLLQHTRWRNRRLFLPLRPASQQIDHSSWMISRYPHRAFLSTHHRFHWHRALRSMVIVRRGCLPPQAILCEMANSYCLLVMIQFRMASSRFLPLPIPFKATSNRLLPLPIPFKATSNRLLPLAVVLVKNHSLPLPIPFKATSNRLLLLPVVLAKRHSLPLPILCEMERSHPLPLPIPSKTTTNHHFPQSAA